MTALSTSEQIATARACDADLDHAARVWYLLAQEVGVSKATVYRRIQKANGTAEDAKAVGHA